MKMCLAISILALLNGCVAVIGRDDFYAMRMMDADGNKTASSNIVCGVKIVRLPVMKKGYVITNFFPPLVPTIPASWITPSLDSDEDNYQLKLTNASADTVYAIYYVSDSASFQMIGRDFAEALLAKGGGKLAFALPPNGSRNLCSTQNTIAILNLKNNASCNEYAQLTPTSKLAIHLLTE